MLKRILGSTAVLAFLALPLAAQARHAASKDVTITGSVIDMNCFTTKGASGAGHKECAEACAKAGVPLAVLGSNGIIYFPVSANPGDPQNPKLLAYVEQKVKVTGVAKTVHGIHTIQIKSVAAAS